MKRILLVEDDPDIALALRRRLESEGHGVTLASDGEQALREVERVAPDLVLLDLALPKLDGTDVCRRLRRDRATAGIPIIMLTARSEEEDVLRGLSLGADDYVTKPFSVKEVAARVQAVLRRARGPAAPLELLAAGAIEVDREGRRASVGGRPVSLTRKEFDLLADLMSRAGRVATREQLLERVWGYDHPGATRTVDAHILQLRKKLGAPVAERIETVIGVGYRFRSDD
jgi:DNA-binding response OmpR family regulator